MDKNNNFFSSILRSGRILYLIMLLFACLAFVTKNYFLAVIEIVITLITIFFYSKSTTLKKEKIAKYLSSLSFQLDNATKDSMINFPLPMTILSLSGNILWYNEEFASVVTDSIPDINTPIQKIIPAIQILKILEDKENISLDITYNNHFYEVVGNVVSSTKDDDSADYTIVLYLIDRTEKVNTVKQLSEQKSVVGVIMVDNYEELFKNTPNESHAYLTAVIEQRIANWVNSIMGSYRKFERDKFYFTVENKYLEETIDNKFSFIEEIQSVNIGNKIPITLSIGIGKGDTPNQSDTYANAAIDLALGRGGDQAIIKNSEGVQYFGGRTENFDRQTKVKSRVVAYAFKELINQASNVIIMGHNSPDIDAFGSAVAIANIVLACDKKPYVLTNDIDGIPLKVMEQFKKREVYQDIFITESAALSIADDNTLLVVCDTFNEKYVQSQKMLKIAKNIVVIDHHRLGSESIQNPVLVFHEPYASSTCEMVTEILQYMEDFMTTDIDVAHALYAGIVLDTKFFSIRTGVRTFEAAGFLRKKGVDTVSIKKLFQNDLPTQIKKARMLADSTVFLNKFAITRNLEDDKQATIIASQVADELLNITNVTASFVICKNGNKFNISARSLGGYNVQRVMEQLGGGGHLNVAGAQFENINYEDILADLEKVIQSFE